MQQSIVGFHQDQIGDWVADLACGHTQHVRHQPPWVNRPWVVTKEGRRPYIGRRLECKQCEPGNRGMTVGHGETTGLEGDRRDAG